MILLNDDVCGGCFTISVSIGEAAAYEQYVHTPPFCDVTHRVTLPGYGSSNWLQKEDYSETITSHVTWNGFLRRTDNENYS